MSTSNANKQSHRVIIHTNPCLTYAHTTTYYPFILLILLLILLLLGMQIEEDFDELDREGDNLFSSTFGPEPLGLTLNRTEDGVVYVKALAEGQQASIQDNIQLGDEIWQVGNLHLGSVFITTSMFHQLIEYVKLRPRKMVMIMRRRLLDGVVSRSLEKANKGIPKKSQSQGNINTNTNSHTHTHTHTHSRKGKGGKGKKPQKEKSWKDNASRHSNRARSRTGKSESESDV